MTMISPRLSQVHCQVEPANALSKPAKELVLPTHDLTEIKHETLTINIGHLAGSDILEMSTNNNIYSNLNDCSFEVPNAPYSQRWLTFEAVAVLFNN